MISSYLFTYLTPEIHYTTPKHGYNDVCYQNTALFLDMSYHSVIPKLSFSYSH